MHNNNFEIIADYKEVNNFCKNISAILYSSNILSDDIIACEIALREVLTNVVKHAYQNNSNNKIKISFELINNKITISITDFGISKKIFEKAKLDYDPNDIENLPEGGFGLFIIEKIMDYTEYIVENGKNTYTMIKLLRETNSK